MSQDKYGWSFSRNWLRMVRDPQFHDVTFLVGRGRNQQRIGCSKTLLSIHCPVFEAMFNSTMLESNANTEIPLKEVDPIVFRTMLHWMVSDRLRLHSITYLQPLIKLADYYQIKPLVKAACKFLKSSTITIYVITDQILSHHHGVDLGLFNNNLRNVALRVRILMDSTISDAAAAIAEHLGVEKGQLQLWRVSHRKNGTVRANKYLEDVNSSSSKAEAEPFYNEENMSDDDEDQDEDDDEDEDEDDEHDDEDDDDAEDDEEDDEEESEEEHLAEIGDPDHHMADMDGNHEENEDVEIENDDLDEQPQPMDVDDSAEDVDPWPVAASGISPALWGANAGGMYDNDSSGESLYEHEVDDYIINGTGGNDFGGLGNANSSQSKNQKKRKSSESSSASRMYGGSASHDKQKRRMIPVYIGGLRKRMDWQHFTGPKPSKGIYVRMIGYGCGVTSENNNSVPRCMHTSLSQSLFRKGPCRICSNENSANAIKGLDTDEKMEQKNETEHSNSKSELPDVAPVLRPPPGNGLMWNNEEIPASCYTKKKEQTLLLFLKYFDVYHQSMSILGSIMVSNDGRIRDIARLIRIIAGWNPGREIIMWEEEDSKTGKITLLHEDLPIYEAQLVDGDIIVFQARSTLLPLMKLPDAREFLKNLAKETDDRSKN